MSGKRNPVRKRDTYFIGVYRRGKLHAIKIGLCSRGQVATRLKNLQTGSVDVLKMLHVQQGSMERKFHRTFSEYRIGRSEFFKPAPKLLKLITNLKRAQRLIRMLEKGEKPQ